MKSCDNYLSFPCWSILEITYDLRAVLKIVNSVFLILRLCTVFCLGNSKFICNELFSLFGVDICFLSEPFSIRRTYKFHHVIFDFQKSVTIYTWINLDVFVNTKLTFPWTFFLNDVNFFLNSTWSFFSEWFFELHMNSFSERSELFSERS